MLVSGIHAPCEPDGRATAELVTVSKANAAHTRRRRTSGTTPLILRNPSFPAAFFPSMPSKPTSSRARERAAQLKQQAENFVAIVARGGNPQHSGDLIDEAIRLAERAKQLRGS